MRITLLVVGKTQNGPFVQGIEEYSKRLGHYIKFDIETIPELKNTKNLSMEQQKEKEADLLLGSFMPGDHIVLLDEHGKLRRSVEFAGWLQKLMGTGVKRLVFVVGGPYGFAPRVYAAAADKMSLSPMTFSHQMIRLVFTEQLYRAFTIINHEPYHHE